MNGPVRRPPVENIEPPPQDVQDEANAWHARTFPAVNGPTEREQRWRAAIDNPDDFRGRRLRECMALADEESATLRARVAVLEQQIAAVRGLCHEFYERSREGRDDMTWGQAARDLRAVLAAGVVDNPTELGSPS